MRVELAVDSEGGHFSMPPRETAIGILARAVAAVEDHQFPAQLSGPSMQMFEYVGPEMGFGMKAVMANTWLLGPLLKRELKKSPATNAGIRTTTAVTIIAAGEKENVLPARARAIVNFRLMPDETI